MFIAGLKLSVMLSLLVVTIMTFNACSRANASAVAIPNPKIDAQLSTHKGEQTAVFAGGCFWGVEAVFDHVKGVAKAESGYAGGSADTAQYYTVASGSTGHAESVRVKYDPSQITYGQLLRVFFAVAHDPTELNRQGPDVGTQYRSSIFYVDDEQKRIAESYIKQLDEAKVFSGKIVTQVVPFKAFYEAESYHQDYLVNHPNEPYIVYNDMPKLVSLREILPELYKQK
ncbi:MAG TPA: peptide-methionine (S)-S-oxide reductase MsrA [Pyrinomonadaceae bacterium]|jgi:methionine-S-sulfoxide reductase|nr:peptide-methionine (S)-S-oxide reductase MsrA [Pyrinomonadaceae bacterium]